MKILVVGGGGREHALAWKLAASPRAQVVFVAPGNGGTARDRRLRNVPITEIHALADFAAAEGVALTVVGPEAPLAAGIVDVFRARNLRIFGPTQRAAQLESSKAYAKDFMQRHGIPTASYQTFTSAPLARAHVARLGAPIVIKADGLAGGKGVVVATTIAEANAAIDALLVSNRLQLSWGDAGPQIVIEQFLAGEEASFIVMSDGQQALALATSQDHKRLRDGDLGPNTGGMGAYSPAPVVTPELHARVMREIIQPAINGMAADGIEYTGFLYAGLMIDRAGQPKTLEFNCRLGDPEAQPIMARMKSDFVPLLEAAIDGRLDRVEVDWDRRTALGVVVAAHGYPQAPRTGDVITALPADTDECITFHAGTQMQDGRLRSSGGRVLCVTALGDTLRAAQKRAYRAVDQVRLDGMLCRRDIGARAVKLRAGTLV